MLQTAEIRQRPHKCLPLNNGNKFGEHLFNTPSTPFDNTQNPPHWFAAAHPVKKLLEPVCPKQYAHVNASNRKNWANFAHLSLAQRTYQTQITDDLISTQLRLWILSPRKINSLQVPSPKQLSLHGRTYKLWFSFKFETTTPCRHQPVEIFISTLWYQMLNIKFISTH